jgi:transposase
MALGKRRESRQQDLWIAADELARTPRHVFYERLNRLLAKAKFDGWVEQLCRPYYAEEGRHSIPPGVYFRMLLVGYFEGIDSQRGIAWRCADSLSLKEFLGYGPTESTPDHSSLTKIQQRLPPEIYREVFQFVLRLVDEHKLLWWRRWWVSIARRWRPTRR